MNETKTWVRFFTVADYEEEERWLREQHRSGWKLKKTVLPCFFVFERCLPEDVVYRLDYKNKPMGGDYLQIFRDYGWEYCNRCAGWLYFRKRVAEMDTEQDGEIFSDDVSRVEMVDHIVKTRILPLLILFFSCLLPNFVRSLERSDPAAHAIAAVFTLLLLVYLFLFVYCGRKLRALRRKYGEGGRE